MANYNSDDIERITAKIFNIVECTNATLFDGKAMPICPRFESLSREQQLTAYEGMKQRIKNEGLQAYINRKRGVWGSRATDSVIAELKAEKYI